MTQKLLNKRTSQPVVDELKPVRGLWARFVGLMGAPELPEGKGLWFARCNWIHTLFVKFPLDIVYLDRDLRVVDLQTSLRPWRLPRPRLRASSVVELRAGSLEAQDIKVGDELICG